MASDIGLDYSRRISNFSKERVGRALEDVYRLSKGKIRAGEPRKGLTCAEEFPLISKGKRNPRAAASCIVPGLVEGVIATSGKFYLKRKAISSREETTPGLTANYA